MCGWTWGQLESESSHISPNSLSPCTSSSFLQLTWVPGYGHQKLCATFPKILCQKARETPYTEAIGKVLGKLSLRATCPFIQSVSKSIHPFIWTNIDRTPPNTAHVFQTVETWAWTRQRSSLLSRYLLWRNLWEKINDLKTMKPQAQTWMNRHLDQTLWSRQEVAGSHLQSRRLECGWEVGGWREDIWGAFPQKDGIEYYD